MNSNINNSLHRQKMYRVLYSVSYDAHSFAKNILILAEGKHLGEAEGEGVLIILPPEFNQYLFY